MLVALLADIHANREALSACLAHAQARNAARFVFLGDHVNYGADPECVVETVLRNTLGSVSGEVVANAPCSVTVVRPPRLLTKAADSARLASQSTG
jgi:hypothetical protein